MGIVNCLYNLASTVEYEFPIKTDFNNILIKRKADYYSVKQDYQGIIVLNTFRTEAAGRPIYFTYELDSAGCNNVPYLDNKGHIIKNNNTCPIHSSSNDNFFATLIVPILDKEDFNRYLPYFMDRYTTITATRTGTYSNDYRLRFTLLRHVVGASECDHYGSSSTGTSSLYFSGIDVSGQGEQNSKDSEREMLTIGQSYTKRYESRYNYYYFYRPNDIDELWLAIVFDRGDRTENIGGQICMNFDSTTTVTVEDIRLKLTRYNTNNAHFDD